MKIKYLFFITTALLLTSCAGEASVSYVGNESTTGLKTVVIHSNRAWDNNKLDGAKWEEQYNLNLSNGKEYTIKIDTEISEPYDIENMSVYEYDYIKTFSEEKREELLKKIYDNETVYLYGEEYIPKSHLKEKIDFNNALIAKAAQEEEAEGEINQGEFPINTRVLSTEISQCEALFDKAPEKLIPAESYSGSSFFGYIDGIPYSIEFSFYDVIDKKYERYSDINESDEIFDYFKQNVCLQLEEHLYEDLEAEDKLSMEEIDSIVNEKLIKFNILDYVKVDGLTKNYMNWDKTFFYVQGVKTFDSDKRATDGGHYCTNEVTVKPSEGEEKIIQVYETASLISAWFDNNIIKRFSIEGYLDGIDVKEGVKLLAFDDIVSILLNELDSNVDNYATDDSMFSYDKMELGYADVVSDNGDKISNVPCWRLSSTFKLGKPIYVNAIDGTVINKVIK